MGVFLKAGPLTTNTPLSPVPSIQNKSLRGEFNEDQSIINKLPSELLAKIFNLLLTWNDLSLVCKTWQLVVDDTHPLKCLKKGNFNPRLLQGPVSALVKDSHEYGRLNTLVGSWMNKQIKQLASHDKKHTAPPSSIVSKGLQFFNSLNLFRDKSLNTDDALEAYDKEKIAKQHEIFILENLLLTTFDTHIPCTNEEVNKWINICKSLGIKTYNPREHLKKVLETINPDEISPKIWEEAFRMQLLFLESIPEEKRTHAICLAAIKQNDLALQFVPKIDRTEAICLAATTQNGWRLIDIPETDRTQSICLAAVTQNGEALEYVPKRKRTQAICLAAIKQSRLALEYVPEIEITQLFA